jgi:hypothetical protein
MKFTIKRSKWLRGNGGSISGLLTAKGNQCCMGQVCSQLGIPDNALISRAYIHDIFDGPSECSIMKQPTTKVYKEKLYEQKVAILDPKLLDAYNLPTEPEWLR